MEVANFLLGLLSPFGISGIALLGVRLLGRGHKSVLLAIPLTVFVACIVGVFVLWQNRRWTAYGLMTAIGFGLIVCLVWWLSHASSSTSGPPA